MVAATWMLDAAECYMLTQQLYVSLVSYPYVRKAPCCRSDMSERARVILRGVLLLHGTRAMQLTGTMLDQQPRALWLFLLLVASWGSYQK